MRHGKKFNHLGRKSAHRKAMLANMATSLILHKRITTTVAKAKALRKYVEPIITKSKTDTTESRRNVFKLLKDKHPIKELFDVVAEKIADRPGGYTRIIRLGKRLGDNAETCIIELVDFNDIYVKDEKKSTGRKRTRRGRKSTSEQSTTDKVTKETTEEAKANVEEKAEVKEEKTEAKKEEKPEAKKEEKKEDKPEAKKEVKVEKEEKKDEVKKEEPKAKEEPKEKKAESEDKKEDSDKK